MNRSWRSTAFSISISFTVTFKKKQKLKVQSLIKQSFDNHLYPKQYCYTEKRQSSCRMCQYIHNIFLLWQCLWVVWVNSRSKVWDLIAGHVWQYQANYSFHAALVNQAAMSTSWRESQASTGKKNVRRDDTMWTPMLGYNLSLWQRTFFSVALVC